MRRRVVLAGLALALAIGPGVAAQQTPLCGPPLTSPPAAAAPKTAAALADGAVTVVVYGSSSTAGVGAGAPEAAFPVIFKRALAAATGAEIVVTARGVGGEDAAGALGRLRADLAADLAAETAAETADLIVWQVGTNDALGRAALGDFARTLEDGADLVAGRGADLVLVDPQHFPRIDGQARYAAFVAAVAAAGAAAQAPVVPRFERMKDAFDRAGDALLAKDRFHMNAAGHACLGADLAAIVIAAAAAAATEAE